VSENALKGAQVDVVTASDPDSGDALTYSMSFSDTGLGNATDFAIRGSTGAITVAHIQIESFD